MYVLLQKFNEVLFYKSVDFIYLQIQHFCDLAGTQVFGPKQQKYCTFFFINVVAW